MVHRLCVTRRVQPYYVVLTPSLSIVDLDWKSMTRGGEGEVSPCYAGVSMPSWMEQESLGKAPRTQSAQWNIKNTIRRIQDGVWVQDDNRVNCRQAGGR
jgi:hypothetical protein